MFPIIKSQNFVALFAVTLLSVGTANASTEVEVGCAVINIVDDAMVQFSGVLGRKDIVDIISSAPEDNSVTAQTAKMLGIDGTMSVLVSINGNGKSYSANYPLNYKIVGKRLEPVLGQNIQYLSSFEDYKNAFGAFPNVKCLSSN